ncbi:dephospho-CoA kinase [Rhizobium azooxidifex]|uniref:Dephospho-CoA kinase n=1 Tax=Mycoplana azooxidifex TaxID=1636188 RepID=A0A7W6D9H5_9HYPH|nr:dephospho-CoA kinase [Mycoplana azooxidifex]MBB3977141.1 dephospho-CoA kinase [Mycoplana azooxidifex]
MIVLGLTGSIGTGKSTTAGMFRELGVPVHDADATVHTLYQGEAVGPVGAAFPAAIKGGIVDRKALAAELAARPAGFSRLEAIVHPLVRQKEADFLWRQRAAGSSLVVLDIPLLFETGADERVDKVLVVTCEPELQRQRVLARPGMTEEKFAMLMARQMPDAEKRQRADFVVKSDNGLEDARKQVKLIVDILKGKSGAHA